MMRLLASDDTGVVAWLASTAVEAALVAGTLAALGESLRTAALVAAGFAALTAVVDGSELLLGDYAGNAVLGALATGFAAWLAWRGGFALAGVAGLIGGWLVVDGVQHRRYGLDRTPVVRGAEAGSRPLRALPRLLAARLLEPFRLDDRV
ncbi:MAG: hypothetical protein ABEJ88_01450 [Halobacterium sp.]